MDLNYQKWKEFAKGKTVIKVILDEYEIVNQSAHFKTHRDYLRHAFSKKGLEVTRWIHDYSASGEVEKWGLVYLRADSDIRTIVEVCGIVGENLQGITENVVSNS